MKTNFALSLSLEGIRLLHRVKGGWHLAGEAAHDAPDLTARLALLRKTALALEPGGIRTKILLPKDLIKYISLDTTRAGEDEVRAALDGATPYDVSELVWDFSKGGGRTYIAAVARETLDEAEAFATDNRFAPVCFASVPEPFTFVGEVFFGPTAAAMAGLAEGDSILRDDEPVHVIGRAHLPQNQEPVAAGPEVAPETAPKPAPKPVPATVPVAGPAPSPEPDAPAPEPVPAPSPAAIPATARPDPVEPQEPEPPVAVFASRARPSLDQRPAPASPAPPSPDAAAPLASDGTGQPLFAHRSAPGSAPRPVEMPPAEPAAARALGAAARDPDLPPPARTTPVAPAMAAPSVTPPAAPSAPRRITPAAPEDPAPAAITRTPSAQAVTEAEKLTIFGARSPAPVRGKPRFLGLILTGLLLLLLALAAWWASTLPSDTLSRWFGGTARTEVAAAPEAAVPAADSGDLSGLAIDPEELADLAEAASQDSQDSQDSPGSQIINPDTEPVANLAAELPDIGAEATVPALVPMSLAEAERLHALTGVWQRAPVAPRVPHVDTTDDLYSAAIDPVTLGSDAVALAPANSLLADTLMLPPGDPPPPGSSFERDANGFILATAEGTVLPNGVIVYAGRPPVEPVARAVPEAVASTAPEAVVAFVADPALAGFRPRSRPADVAVQIERAALGGLTLDELAGFRPRPRPAGLQIVTTDTDAIAAAVADAAAPPNFDDASQYAVALSPRPGARPRNFDRVVATARASNQQAPAAAAASLASAAPAPQVAVPSGPIPGGVARAATEENVIALREVTLIGVFGTSGSRVALVRLANGRVVRVSVGDSLDGGQVVSISETALNYVKRGRTYTLALPA